MKILPKARDQDVLIQAAENEILVYDLITDQAFCLNETSRIIFEACDGKTTFKQLKQQTNFTDELINLALDGLKRKNLIGGEHLPDYTAVSRREMIRQAGLTSMIALPLISSIFAPSAAQAASGGCINIGGQPQGVLVVGNGTSLVSVSAARVAAISAANIQCCSNSSDPATSSSNSLTNFQTGLSTVQYYVFCS